ncbi:MAG: RNA methyltransferase [Actinomycetota bacterium]
MSGTEAVPVSPRNDGVKRIRRLVRRAGDRASEGVYVVEGPRALEEVVRHGAVVETMLVADDTEVPDAARGAAAVWSVPADALATVADSRTPQGVLAVVERGSAAGEWPTEVTHAVIGDRLGDPGNVGTIVRAAAAFGAVVGLATGSADPWGPKAVRASAGAIASVPVVVDSVAALVQRCRERGLRLVGLDGGAATSIADVGPGVAWVVGSEAHGLSDELRAHLDEVARIPTTGGVESLNAAMAATLALSSSFGASRS